MCSANNPAQTTLRTSPSNSKRPNSPRSPANPSQRKRSTLLPHPLLRPRRRSPRRWRSKTPPSSSRIKETNPLRRKTSMRPWTSMSKQSKWTPTSLCTIITRQLLT
jgi:hypothetical protein